MAEVPARCAVDMFFMDLRMDSGREGRGGELGNSVLFFLLSPYFFASDRTFFFLVRI